MLTGWLMNTGWLESAFVARVGGMGFGCSVMGVVWDDEGIAGVAGVLSVDVDEEWWW